MKLRRLILAGLLFVTGLAHADWATDRAGSAGYVTVTTLASVIDEAVPFCVVYLSDMPSAFWTAMDAAGDTDGKTIRVSTSDGSTQLPCVPLGVNTSTDTGCLIFLDTGSSASVDVAFRVYNGNAALSMPSASGGMGEQAVFAAYAGVYFPGMATRDFTSGGRTLTAVNSPTTDTSGYEGITAAKYNGTSQYHRYNGTQAVSNWPITVEALAYNTNATNSTTVIGIANGSGSINFVRLTMRGDVTGPPADPAGLNAIGASGGLPAATTSSGYSASTWHYLAACITSAATAKTVYLDGGNSGSSTTSITAPTAFSDLAIGCRYEAAVSGYLAGRIAVALLSTSAQTANYMSTQHQNWLGNLYSAGSWTPNSVAPGTTGWVLFQTAAQTSTADADWATISNALVDDANAATVTLDDVTNLYSETLKLTNPNYGVTVPSGAPSYTVEFRIKRSGQTSAGKTIHDKTVKFIDDTGTLVGTNLADTGTTWPSTAATADYVLTGYTPDGTEFTSGAGLAIQADGSATNGNTTTSVFVAWIKVSWTGTDTTAKTRGFFALAE